ncbi:S-antigen protein [Colletotrichum trifolii]|uniref:S-antigen protein n=1 Tax=Colletotrichum trifolii TaxID=5466 RepID=A0A4R8QSB2_COLTR|nr:S-antigen protein [Colletotrichum trifolii]
MPQDNVPNYVENYLPVEFYFPEYHGRAVFSTDNGKKPYKELHLAATVPLQRQMHLWSAEEIQGAANSIRRKFTRVVDAIRKPDCWERLHDYFDCAEIYEHGALNLWNLINTLSHENSELDNDLSAKTAYEVGIWCDNWVSKGNNQQKLREFRDWADVGGLVLGDMQDFFHHFPSELELLRQALIHRQRQARGAPDAMPAPYPQNGLVEHWSRTNLHNWLAGHSVYPTTSGLPQLTHSNPQSQASLATSHTEYGHQTGYTPARDDQAEPIEPAIAHRAPVVARGTNAPKTATVQPVASHLPSTAPPAATPTAAIQGVPVTNGSGRSAPEATTVPRPIFSSSDAWSVVRRGRKTVCLNQDRERSVFVRVSLQKPTEEATRMLYTCMVQWGTVEHVSEHNQNFKVTFSDASSSRKAAVERSVNCNGLGRIYIHPMYHTKLGSELNNPLDRATFRASPNRDQSREMTQTHSPAESPPVPAKAQSKASLRNTVDSMAPSKGTASQPDSVEEARPALSGPPKKIQSSNAKPGDQALAPKNKETRAPKDKETQALKDEKNEETQAPKNKDTRAPKDKETQAPKNKETRALKSEEVQTPKNKETRAPKNKETQAPKSKETQAPKSKETQAPKDKETRAPKDKETQAPKNEKMQAPRNIETQAPKNEETQTPKDKETQTPKDKETRTSEDKEINATPATETTTSQSRKSGKSDNSPHKQEISSETTAVEPKSSSAQQPETSKTGAAGKKVGSDAAAVPDATPEREYGKGSYRNTHASRAEHYVMPPKRSSISKETFAHTALAKKNETSDVPSRCNTTQTKPKDPETGSATSSSAKKKSQNKTNGMKKEQASVGQENEPGRPVQGALTASAGDLEMRGSLHQSQTDERSAKGQPSGNRETTAADSVTNQLSNSYKSPEQEAKTEAEHREGNSSKFPYGSLRITKYRKKQLPELTFQFSNIFGFDVTSANSVDRNNAGQHRSLSQDSRKSSRTLSLGNTPPKSPDGDPSLGSMDVKLSEQPTEGGTKQESSSG